MPRAGSALTAVATPACRAQDLKSSSSGAVTRTMASTPPVRRASTTAATSGAPRKGRRSFGRPMRREAAAAGRTATAVGGGLADMGPRMVPQGRRHGRAVRGRSPVGRRPSPAGRGLSLLVWNAPRAGGGPYLLVWRTSRTPEGSALRILTPGPSRPTRQHDRAVVREGHAAGEGLQVLLQGRRQPGAGLAAVAAAGLPDALQAVLFV